MSAWEPMPSIFPSGMDPSWVRHVPLTYSTASSLNGSPIRSLWQVPAPLVLHNRMFDWPSAYSGNYSFEVALTQDMSMPVDVRSHRIPGSCAPRSPLLPPARPAFPR